MSKWGRLQYTEMTNNEIYKKYEDYNKLRNYTSRRTSVIAVSDGATRSFSKWDLWKACNCKAKSKYMSLFTKQIPLSNFLFQCAIMSRVARQKQYLLQFINQVSSTSSNHATSFWLRTAMCLIKLINLQYITKRKRTQILIYSLNQAQGRWH